MLISSSTVILPHNSETMSLLKLLVKNFKTHILVWSAIILYILLIDPISANTGGRIIGSITFFLGYMLTFYLLAAWIIPTYWKRNYFLFSLFMCLSCILFFSIDYLALKFFIPLFDHDFAPKGFDAKSIAANAIILYIALTIAAFSYYFNKQNTKRIKEQNEREKLLLAKELNFLKGQFNSHITFNFLNYCYSHVHKSSREAAEAIELFSNMLRYSLALKPDEKVTLASEIEYINNFIDLQKILSGQVYVEFTYSGMIKNKTILPLMLITFVENAFKHGQFNDPNKPIKMELEANNSAIIFIVTNKVIRKPITKPGIGQQNLKQLLNLHYNHKFQLSFEEDEEEYISSLILEI